MRNWRVVAWAKAHRSTVDAALALLVTTIALVLHFAQQQGDGRIYRPPDVATVGLVVATCLPLAWRRSRAIPAALTVAAFQAACEFYEINGPNWVPLVIAVYSLGAYAAGRPRLATACVVAGIIVGLLLLGIAEEVIQPVEGIGAFASVAVPFVVGDNIRRRRNELAELAERAERAERERELIAAQRVTEERTRIARDLHDVIAHSVSAIVIQAAAARRNLDRAPVEASSLLVNIEETGRRTMSELRHTLGVLRNSDDADASVPAEPLPSIGDLDDLVDSATDLDIRFSVAGALDSVPSGLGCSAFRVVQEALTNVRRHAGPDAIVDVRVERTGSGLDVRIEDDGRGASTTSVAGYGLIGMTERVTAFGGTLRAGPRRAGGWQVWASFPLPAEAASPARSTVPSEAPGPAGSALPVGSPLPAASPVVAASS